MSYPSCAQVQVGHDGSTNWITSDESMTTKGTLTLLAQTYTSDSAKYGYEVMRHLSNTQIGAHLFDKLERQQRVELPSGSRVDTIRYTVQEILDTLVVDLSSLASLHKESLSQIMLERSLENEDEDLEKDSWEAKDHFTRAVNAYDAMLAVYQHLWRIMKPGALNVDPHEEFSPNEQAQIVLGVSLGYWDLYEVHNLWFDNTAGPTTFDDVSVQYRNILQAESWCENSMAILSGADEDVDNYRDADVIHAKQTLALVEVRFGMFLLDIFDRGYVLDIDGNLHQDQSSLPEYDTMMHGFEPREDQERFLELTKVKISRGMTLYTELAREQDDYKKYRQDLADSRHFMGVAYTYQLRWKDAADEFEISVSLYDQLFNEYRESRLDANSLEVASNLLQTTPMLWGAYFYITGKTDDAKKVFRRHLTFQRYYERRVPLDQPLVDEDEDEDYFNAYTQNARAKVQGELLKDYQMKLNEYLQLLSEFPPDGSYYDLDLGFTSTGDAFSLVKHDRVYEGSIRSAIGSLLLANDEVREAITELQLSVDLLRYGLRDHVAYDENGEVIDYSVEQDIANTLLNLSYAQQELKQWNSAMQSFSEAMDIRETKGLLDGGGTNERSSKNTGEDVTSIDEKLSSYIKGQRVVKEKDVILESFYMLDNTTSLE